MSASYTNINDPAGIKALLDQLRASQAWQESVNDSRFAHNLSAQQPSVSPDDVGHISNPIALDAANVLTVNINEVKDATTTEPDVRDIDATTTSPVASLLSQLQTSVAWPSPSPIISPSYGANLPTSAATTLQVTQEIDTLPLPTVIIPSSAKKQDIRYLTFQQALPYLTSLAQNADFVAAIVRMKEEQAALERKLWQERQAVLKKQEQKVVVAKTKARMLGDGISKYEADRMAESFKQELRKFDRERVLTAWDGLTAKQQAALEALGVPTMFVTESAADREKQQRVIHVLEGICQSELA